MSELAVVPIWSYDQRWKFIGEENVVGGVDASDFSYETFTLREEFHSFCQSGFGFGNGPLLESPHPTEFVGCNIWFDFDLGRPKRNLICFSSILNKTLSTTEKSSNAWWLDVNNPRSFPQFDDFRAELAASDWIREMVRLFGQEQVFAFFMDGKPGMHFNTDYYLLEPGTPAYQDFQNLILHPYDGFVDPTTNTPIWFGHPDRNLQEAVLYNVMVAGTPSNRNQLHKLSTSGDFYVGDDTEFPHLSTIKLPLSEYEYASFFSDTRPVYDFMTNGKENPQFQLIDKVYIMLPRHGNHSSCRLRGYLVRFQDDHCEFFLVGAEGHVRIVCGHSKPIHSDEFMNTWVDQHFPQFVEHWTNAPLEPLEVCRFNDGHLESNTVLFPPKMLFFLRNHPYTKDDIYAQYEALHSFQFSMSRNETTNVCFLSTYSSTGPSFERTHTRFEMNDARLDKSVNMRLLECVHYVSFTVVLNKPKGVVGFRFTSNMNDRKYQEFHTYAMLCNDNKDLLISYPDMNRLRQRGKGNGRKYDFVNDAACIERHHRFPSSYRSFEVSEFSLMVSAKKRGIVEDGKVTCVNLFGRTVFLDALNKEVTKIFSNFEDVSGSEKLDLTRWNFDYWIVERGHKVDSSDGLVKYFREYIDYRGLRTTTSAIFIPFEDHNACHVNIETNELFIQCDGAMREQLRSNYRVFRNERLHDGVYDTVQVLHLHDKQSNDDASVLTSLDWSKFCFFFHTIVNAGPTVSDLLANPERIYELATSAFLKTKQARKITAPVPFHARSEINNMYTIVKSSHVQHYPMHANKEFKTTGKEKDGLLMYLSKEGIVVMDGNAENHLLISYEDGCDGKFTSTLYNVPLMSANASDEDMEKAIDLLILRTNSFSSNIDFKRMIREEIGDRTVKLNWEVRGAGDLSFFKNFLFLVEMQAFIKGLRIITPHRALDVEYDLFVSGEFESVYQPTMFSTTEKYSMITGKPELLSVTNLESLRLWSNRARKFRYLSEDIRQEQFPVQQMDSKIKHFVDSVFPSTAVDFIREFVDQSQYDDRYVFVDLGDDRRSISVPLIDMDSAMLHYIRENRESFEAQTNEDLFLLPTNLEGRSTPNQAAKKRRGVYIEDFITNLVHVMRYNRSYVQNYPNRLVNQVLDVANAETVVMTGKLRNLLVKECMIVVTRESGDENTSSSSSQEFVHIFESDGPIEYQNFDDNTEWHYLYNCIPTFQGRFRYFRKQTWFSFSAKLRDLFFASLATSTKGSVSLGAFAHQYLSEIMARKWNHVLTEHVPWMYHEEGKKDLELMKNACLHFHNDHTLLLGINIRSCSLVVGTSPWNFVEFPSAQSFFRNFFKDPNAVSMNFSGWLDNNHQVLYNNEDLQLVHLNEHWVCVAAFGVTKSEREKESDARFHDYEYIAVHDVRKLSDKDRSEYMSGTFVHQFSCETAVGYFKIGDFAEDLKRFHFFNMFIAEMVENDLVLQGPNDYLVIGGFGNESNWKNRCFDASCAQDVYHHRVVTRTNSFYVKFNGITVFGSAQSSTNSHKGGTRSGSANKSGNNHSSSSSTRNNHQKGDNNGNSAGNNGDEDGDEDPPLPDHSLLNSKCGLKLRKKPVLHRGLIPFEETPPIVWKVARLRPPNWPKQKQYLMKEVKTWPLCVVKLILPDDTLFFRPFEPYDVRVGMPGKCRVNKAYVWEIQRYNFHTDPQKNAQANHGVETESLGEDAVAVSAFCDHAGQIIEYIPHTLIRVDSMDIENHNATCSAGIHVFTERHHVVLMTGDAFGGSVTPLSLIRSMLFSQEDRLAEERQAYRQMLDIANVASGRDRCREETTESEEEVDSILVTAMRRSLAISDAFENIPVAVPIDEDYAEEEDETRIVGKKKKD